jgi:pectate lyase
MRSGGRTCSVAIFLLAVLVVVVSLAPDRLRSLPVVEAANVSPPLQTFQSWKGFVVAKAERSMTVHGGVGTIQVVVTEKTRVVGLRNLFAQIAIDDVVRVEGSMTADKHVVANRVEVVLASDSMTMGQQTRKRPVNSLLSVVLNGGITIPLR